MRLAFPSLPCPDLPGHQLWVVHFASSYHDGDGTSPVDERIFVLAESHADALKRTESLIKSLRKQYNGGEVTATVVPLENLVPARDGRNDGRLGWHSTIPLKPVLLSQPRVSADGQVQRYRLAVCLVKE